MQPAFKRVAVVETTAPRLKPGALRWHTVRVRIAAIALLAVLLLATATSAAGASSPALVSFRQTGGFAGLDRGLVVARSGDVVSDGLPLKKAHLTRPELARLKLALANARFAGLPKTYESEQPIADGFIYRIAYAGRVVAIEEGAKPPPRVQRVFTLLERLVHG